MTATEERKALIDKAAELQAELQKFNSRIFTLIDKLLSEADRLKLAAADERSSGDYVKVTKVKFGGGGVTPEPSLVSTPDAPLAPGKRACSICRKTGHRSTTCPQADVKYKADRAPKKKGKR